MGRGHKTLSVVRLLQALIFSACLPLSAAAWRLEAGEVVLNDTFTTPTFTSVSFTQPFDVVPVIIALPTSEGGDPSALRIRNVSLTGFEVAQVEPPGNDGPHVDMTISFVAAEPGIHSLPDGTPGGQTIIVGQVTTSSVQRSSVVGGPQGTTLVNFGATLGGQAAVVATIQTTNSEPAIAPDVPSEPWLTVSVLNPTASSAEFALERSEVDEGTVLAETIGFIAAEAGVSGTFAALGGVPISWSAVRSTDTIVGITQLCEVITYSGSSFPEPRVVATKNTRDGADGGWLRQCSLSGTSVGLAIQEDISNDSESNHTTEVAGILAFSDSFHALFEPDLEVSKTGDIVEDPLNGTLNPFAIPGSRVRYTFEIENMGNGTVDADSIDLVDEIPAGTALVVADIDGPGSGPVDFIDGPVSSGLTLDFFGLGSTTDGVDFSNDGGASFSYEPLPGLNGVDGAVTHVRIQPGGAFAAQTTSTSPSAVFELDVIVQ
ncbi:MAG: hypothetical protein AAFV54_01920 [Pseudomonadota bacterium]